MSAVEQFQEFVVSGQYQLLKQLTQRQSETKDFIRSKLQLREGNRFEFEKFGYVAKFVRKEIACIDHQALLDELSCYIMFDSMINMGVLNFDPSNEVKEHINEFLLPSDTYIKPTFNNAGKAYISVNKGYFENYPPILGYLGEIRAFSEREVQLDKIEIAYKKVLKKVGNELCKSVKFELGCLSVIPKKSEYDLEAIYQEMGQDFLLENSKVKMSVLNDLITMGIIEKRLVEQFKKVEDIRVDFILQSLESEKRSFKALEQRKSELQQLLVG